MFKNTFMHYPLDFESKIKVDNSIHILKPVLLCVERAFVFKNHYGNGPNIVSGNLLPERSNFLEVETAILRKVVISASDALRRNHFSKPE